MPWTRWKKKEKSKRLGIVFIFTILILKNNCNNYLGGRLRFHESQTYQNCLKQLYLLDKHPYSALFVAPSLFRT